MTSDEIRIYDANNGAEAELIREALQNENIEAYVDNHPSPLDGLSAMGQGTPVFVAAKDEARARLVIDRWLKEKQDGGEDESQQPSAGS